VYVSHQIVELSGLCVRVDLKQRDGSMYLGIPNARTIQETQKVQEGQPRQEPPVYLSNELCLVDPRNVYVRVVDGSYVLLAILRPNFPLLKVLRLFALGGGHVGRRGKGNKRTRRTLLSLRKLVLTAETALLRRLSSRVRWSEQLARMDPVTIGWGFSQDEKQ